ncbi:sugar phosphate nucleotidyltransferase [Paenibacillus nasutitermitis]|uniref:Mannose-1-phosphate guanylyltransferase n=1 Tax=Paenibacillus nasutitermitis TaxID=1652958 RepID=A0A916ZFL2_9BACL|nr:sugar phosphate nucleotidyltransferase [Paenibacillus nasutitermitis]GGD94502.1 mannose-1-phosphate guanylyltransferase [Paenibacillus nasutitermitis]
MKIILLSGGSGKRLWPLSSEIRSKQFLQLLQDRDGRQISMVQHTMAHLQQLGLQHEVIIAASGKQMEYLHKQLGPSILAAVEPERRDTYPAVLLSCAYLASHQNASADETVIVLPVDHHTNLSFYLKLFELDKLIQADTARIGLIGVAPSSPSGKFGYLLPDPLTSNKEAPLAISQFIEKPDETYARALIDQGALWNCGVFAFRLSAMLDELVRRGLPTDYHRLREQYGALPSISFDYEVVERSSSIAALVYEGAWSDMGTWDSLSHSMDNAMYGIGLLDNNCTNTNVVNELPIPVLVTGINDAVVVAGHDGILVTGKHAASGLKPLLERMQGQALKTDGDTRYGWARTLDKIEDEGRGAALTRRIHVIAGERLSCTVQKSSFLTWMLLTGQGEYRHAGEYLPLSGGQHVQPLPGSFFQAVSSCDLLEIRTTPP